MLKGSHNVRYETMPMNMVDQNGKPVQQKSGTCTDATGKERHDGEEYERPNARFKYKCSGGIEEVVACIGSERTNKARIEVGQNLDVDGFWHKCQSFENGSFAYTQENSCIDMNNKQLHTGDEFTVANLRFACDADNGKYKIVGCSFKSESGQEVSLNPGETKEDDKLTHQCESKNDTLQYSAKGNGCSRRGKDYKENDTFQENHLKYVCKNGLVDITGFTSTRTRIWLLDKTSQRTDNSTDVIDLAVQLNTPKILVLEKVAPLLQSIQVQTTFLPLVVA